MNYGLIARKASGWVSGMNWWRLGLYAAIIAGLFGAGYLMGGVNAKVECQKDKTELAEKRIKWIADFTNVQSEIAVLREKETIRLVEVISEVGVKLDEEIAEKPELVECNLTDGEFLQFNKLAEETRK